MKKIEIIIKRHGLSSEPQDFVENKIISNILQTEGAETLPVTLVDGEVIKKMNILLMQNLKMHQFKILVNLQNRR